MTILCVLLCGAAAALYINMRVVEWSTLQSLPSVSALFEMKLSRLYRIVLRVERERRRARRHQVIASEGGLVALVAKAVDDTLALWWMRLNGRVPPWRRLGVAQTLLCAMRIIDDVVDGDRKCNGTRAAFFAYMTRMLKGFGDPAKLTEQALPEIVALVYATRGCRELLAFDPHGLMLDVWDGYTYDANRVIAGTTAVNRLTLGRITESFVELHYLLGLMLGLNEERARLFAELDVPNRTLHDTIDDFLRDAKKGQLGISLEALRDYGIDVDDVRACTSVAEMAEIPGLVRWLADNARRGGEWWREVGLPRLRAEVVPHIQSRLFRKEYVQILMRREVSFAAQQKQWEEFLPS